MTAAAVFREGAVAGDEADRADAAECVVHAREALAARAASVPALAEARRARERCVGRARIDGGGGIGTGRIEEARRIKARRIKARRIDGSARLLSSVRLDAHVLGLAVREGGEHRDCRDEARSGMRVPAEEERKVHGAGGCCESGSAPRDSHQGRGIPRIFRQIVKTPDLGSMLRISPVSAIPREIDVPRGCPRTDLRPSPDTSPPVTPPPPPPPPSRPDRIRGSARAIAPPRPRAFPCAARSPPPDRDPRAPR